jgi:hypothetical protein
MRSIASALGLSCVCSITIIALTLGRFPLSTHFIYWYGPVTMTISHARFLSHIYKHHLKSVEHKPEVAFELASTKSLFGNGSEIPVGTLIKTWFSVLGYPALTSNQGILQLCWPTDQVEIVLRAAYCLQVITSLLIMRFHLQIIRNERAAWCSVSHDWQCNQCTIKYEKTEETHVQQGNTPILSTWIHPETILMPSLVTSLTVNSIIIYVANILLWNTDRHNSYLLSALAVVNIVQNIHHLNRLRNWHAYSGEYTVLLPSDIVARTRRTFWPLFGALLLLLVFIVPACAMTLGLEVYGFGNIPPLIITLHWIEGIVIVVNISQTWRIMARDRRAAAALCPQYGHNWVCGRGCSATLIDESV